MMTPYQRQKQVHWFNVLDGNKDGFLERADFEIIGQRFAHAMGRKSGPIYDQLVAGWVATWEQMLPEVDQNRDGQASLEEVLISRTG